MSRRISAGILLFRRRDDVIEVLLAHPGGPFFANRDLGNWTVPKGEPDDDEVELLVAAAREFEEETGHALAEVSHDPGARPLDLGSVVQASGKRVHCWAVEGDLDPEHATSNTFEMVWPPGTGRARSFPEIDRVEWFSMRDASGRVNPSQSGFIERLQRALSDPSAGTAGRG